MRTPSRAILAAVSLQTSVKALDRHDEGETQFFDRNLRVVTPSIVWPGIGRGISHVRLLLQETLSDPMKRRDFLKGFVALAADPGASREQIARHRNLGKALYETQTTHAQAVEEFRKALELTGSPIDRLNYGLALMRAGRTGEGVGELERVQKQDPRLPHTWFNLGITYKREGRYPEGTRQFERLAELAPGEAAVAYNLGILYRQAGKVTAALKEFEAAARLDPALAAPHFQLQAAYRQAGRTADADRELRLFQEIKKRQEGAAIPEDMEWSVYAELYEVVDPKDAADDSPAPELRFTVKKTATGVDPGTAGLVVCDVDGDGEPDLVVWSRAGIRLFRRGASEFKAEGLGDLKDVIAVVPGDFDNDGLADLCVLTEHGPALYRNRRGRFERARAELPRRRFEAALWLDYDHDYDLDLLLLGPQPALLRNQGNGRFVERTGDFPFVSGHALTAAAFRLVRDGGSAIDVVVSYRDRGGVLYRDRLGGKFEAESIDALPAGTRALVAEDLDNDGWIDLLALSDQGALLLVNAKGRLEARPLQPVASRGLTLADLENRGLADLVAGNAVLRNQGLGRLIRRPTSGLPAAVAWVTADFNADGRSDLAAVTADGSVQLVLNQTPLVHRWLRVRLAGVKNLKLAPGAEVEVKAGARYQKRVYQGVPLLFGLRRERDVDTVRITWPNGLIQNESRQTADRARAYREAPRLSGSCPMIYTWNGRKFQFITDVLGVAPLGAAAGEGQYFPVDHDEYVQIPRNALVPRDGHYEIRICEELREVAYLDAVHLIAVDHPAEVEIFTSDKFTGPPFPEFRLFGVTRRIYPIAARDDRGRDVRPRLLRRDGRYVDGFARDYAGVAEMHTLELEFPPGTAGDNWAVLVLHGWLDWADGSTFVGKSQEPGGGLVMPYLQVKDTRGRWVTVIEDMGIPAGKPKTIIVDLSGKFLSRRRAIRIVTNLVVYWEEIFLSEETAPPEARLSSLPPAAADLGFRGFSRPILHPRRRQPEAFNYAHVSPTSMWNPTPGLYTRYGDVRALLDAVDDRLVIMGSGDELRVRFPADALPEMPRRWGRDFLLFVDGWAKDADLNTAFSQTVEPLPFHAMSQYPYPAGERYPDDADHRAYRAMYNIRPALRLIRPLASPELSRWTVP